MLERRESTRLPFHDLLSDLIIHIDGTTEVYLRGECRGPMETPTIVFGPCKAHRARFSKYKVDNKRPFGFSRVENTGEVKD